MHLFRRLKGACVTWTSPQRNTRTCWHSCSPVWEVNSDYKHITSLQYWFSTDHTDFSLTTLRRKLWNAALFLSCCPEFYAETGFQMKLPQANTACWWQPGLITESVKSEVLIFTAAHIDVYGAVESKWRKGCSNKYLPRKEHSCMNNTISRHPAQGYKQPRYSEPKTFKTDLLKQGKHRLEKAIPAHLH